MAKAASWKMVISTKMAKIENLAKVKIGENSPNVCANGMGNGEFGLNGEYCKRSPKLAKIEITWRKVKNTVAWSSLRLAICGKHDLNSIRSHYRSRCLG